MISIESYEFKNFLGYGDYLTKISLNEHTGISSIDGESDENDKSNPGDEKRVGSGKSSMAIEAPFWCLFGHLTYLEKPGDSVINWNTGKNCFVKITTTDGYEIIRTRKVAGASELVILKDGEDLTKSTTSPSQDFLNNLFKIDHRTFMVSAFFGQLSEGFLNLTDAKRRAIFERFIKITSFNSIAATAKDKASSLSESISVLDSKIENLINSKKSIESEIDELLIKIKEFDDGKNVKINNIKTTLMNKKSEIDKQILIIKNKIDIINDKIKNFIMSNIDDVKQQWDTYENTKSSNDTKSTKKSELNQLKSKFENKLNNINWELKELNVNLSGITIIDGEELSLAWSMFNNAGEKLLKLRSDLDIVNDNARDLKRNVQNLSNDISNITNIKEFQKCPKCSHDITEEHICSTINEKTLKMKELEPKILELEVKKKNLNQAICTLELINEPSISIDQLNLNIQKVNDIKAKIIPINESRIKVMAGIEDIENQMRSIKIVNISKPDITIENAKDQLNEYNNLKGNVVTYNSEIFKLNSDFKAKILETQNEINEVKNSDNPYELMVSNKKSQLDNIVIDISKQQDELSKQKKLKMHVDYIRDSYINKKKMRAFWIGEIVPTLNKFIKYYFNIFEIEDKIEFDEFLNVKLDRWSYKTHSGGEKKRIDLSIMFALNDLHSSIFGPQCNLMVLDEVDGRIDPFTTNRLVALLSDDMIKRDGGLTNIFIISHKEIMRDRFPNRIMVKNKLGNSYIVNE